MKICAHCFDDNEIRQFILSSSSESASCECCGITDRVVDLDLLYDFFTEFVGLYCPDDSASYSLVDAIQNDWNIFASPVYAARILAELNSRNVIQLSPDSKVRQIDEILNCNRIWDVLKLDVSTRLRFFTDISAFQWNNYIVNNYVLKKNTQLFRARILPDGCKKLTPRQMGCPPANITPAGRANPLGIPYLYLCDNKETTLYETRSLYLDKVCVGSFKTVRDLNIVNFNESINPFFAFSDGDNPLIDSIKRRIVMDNISKDLSKPLRRFDTELEYVPTQFICEYCKLNQADGIMFTSSLHPMGSNIVLFNPLDAKCTKVECLEINNVTISAIPSEE